MRMVFGLVLVLGLGLAGFAVYVAQGYVGNYQAELEAERAARDAIVPTVEVFVTNHMMKYGDRITKKDVRIVKWPKDAIPAGTFTSAEELFPNDGRELRTVLRTMEKSEAVLAVKVSAPGDDAGVSSRLGAGMRAFAIRVDVASGVSGFLRPGDRVDIYWSGRNADVGAIGEFTKLIQANVSLLAVDQTADGDSSNPNIARTVTVEVTPQEVAALAQAQNSGQLTLALVGNNDLVVADTVQVDQRGLLGVVEQEKVEVIAEKVCSIKTRKGAEVVEIPVACTN
ncbi:Flp pilus assembly protein CpaB [Pseudogemmobacter sp. W21_MBD1_M6]|uniref:Flp pilus assembly protein CpaB n=1 Tax=Pseudogemmobacter sp. W21_MBD1_M6 TaxID=3240271 RepID=UPI003F96F18D